jgi:hypothetical protein
MKQDLRLLTPSPCSRVIALPSVLHYLGGDFENLLFFGELAGSSLELAANMPLERWS